MPHQCTNCGHTFPDGSKEMLSGCPDCGGNKFQFKPSGVTDDGETGGDSAAEGAAASTADASTGDSVTIEPEPPSAERQTSPPETEGSEGEDEVVTNEPADASAEGPAQSSARSDVVDSSELTAAGSMGPQSAAAEEADTEAATAGQPAAEQSEDDRPADDQPADDQAAADSSEGSNLDQLRKELNDQFESIRIVSPGQYELNLMELYDREEYIISLREDGRYVIEVPDSWGDDA